MKVFIAALDWGLGHTTRIIPVIDKFINGNHTVLIGSTKKQQIIFEEFFPKIEQVTIPTYSPVYSKGENQSFSLLMFLPKLIFFTLKEYIILKGLIKKHKFDQVISDNRYGFFNKRVHSIFLTHQLRPIVPVRLPIIGKLVHAILHEAIRKFDICWVPDNKTGLRLTGELSDNTGICKVEYIGILSRFTLVASNNSISIPELLIIISGPENQRTQFENKILEAIKLFKNKLRYLIIRGLPEGRSSVIPNSLNHCPSNKLRTLIENSKYIICRSGYSTIMDLIYLKRTAMLVPTPGQTEQEYLANYLNDNNEFLTIKQENIDIQNIIDSLDLFQGN